MAKRRSPQVPNSGSTGKGTKQRGSSSKGRSRMQGLLGKGKKRMGQTPIVGRHWELSVDDIGEPQRMSDARQLYLPVINIAALVIFAVVATDQVNKFKSSLETKIASIQTSFELLSSKVEETSSGKWYAYSMRVWCADTERLNPKWRCGPVDTMSSMR